MRSLQNINKVRLTLLALLILGAPFSKFPSISTPMFDFPSFRLGLYQIVAAIFVLLCIAPTIKNIPKLIKQNRFALFSIGTLSVIAIINLVYSENIKRSLLLTSTLLFLLCLVLCVWWFVSTQKELRRIINVKLILWGGIFYGILGLVQFIIATVADNDLGLLCANCTNGVFGFTRINGFSAEPQFFANALIPFYFISLIEAIKGRQKVAKYSLALIIVAITLTFSRGAYLAITSVTLALLCWLFITKKYSILRLLIIGLYTLFFLAIGLTLLIASSSYKNRTTPDIAYKTVDSMMEHLTLGYIDLPNKQLPKTDVNQDYFVPAGLIEASTQDRLGSADLAIKAWSNSYKNSLIGVGLGNLGPYTVEHINSDSPGNLTVYIYYVLILAEVGLLGLLAFLSLHISALIGIMRKYKNQNHIILAIICSFVAFLIQYLFFGTYINSVYIWVWLGILLGLPALQNLNYNVIRDEK